MHESSFCPLSQRVRDLKPSAIRQFFDLAASMRGEVLSLSIGEPDFVTPWQIREAGIYSLEQGRTHYSSNQGLSELRRAIADYSAERFDIHYAAESEILVTVGGSEALDLSFRALLDPGDEILLPEPCFVAYEALAELLGARVRHIPLSQDSGFRLRPEALEAALSPRSKLLVLAYPNNPTGASFSRQDWEALLPVLRRHPRLQILSDELYAELHYAAEPFCSPASLPELRPRCIVVGGFSKAFAMTGWRIGYALAPEPIMAAMTKIHQFGIMSAPTTAQYAAIEALRHGGEEVARMREAYNQRRRYICAKLEAMGLPVFEPEGAFYVFPDIRFSGLSSMEFCQRFLQEERVAIVPGLAFGPSGEGHVRISYAASMDVIREAMKRLDRFCQSLRP